MDGLDDGKYRLFAGGPAEDYAGKSGRPPEKGKKSGAYAGNMFDYFNSKDSFIKFLNRIPLNFSNIKIIDKNGKSIFIDMRGGRPSGRRTKKEPGRTVRYGGAFSPRQISEAGRYAHYLILKRDLKESAERLNFNRPARPPSKEIRENNKPLTGSGSLEKDFKAMAAKGQASDVLAAFKAVTGSLPEKDKADLSVSLKSSGIATSSDLQGLLNRWKNEVQNDDKKQTPERTRARSRSRDLTISLTDAGGSLL
jgi:hypothetical protein